MNPNPNSSGGLRTPPTTSRRRHAPGRTPAEGGSVPPVSLSLVFTSEGDTFLK